MGFCCFEFIRLFSLGYMLCLALVLTFEVEGFSFYAFCLIWINGQVLDWVVDGSFFYGLGICILGFPSNGFILCKFF